MLASIILEGTGVRLPKLAMVSLMRASAPAPHSLLRHVWHEAGIGKWMVPFLALSLSFTTTVLQFTSTILLADVDTGFIRE
jgi:hypothetical protein